MQSLHVFINIFSEKENNWKIPKYLIFLHCDFENPDWDLMHVNFFESLNDFWKHLFSQISQKHLFHVQ